MIEKEARLPTDDERDGMNWYNSLTDAGREYWLRRTGTFVPADAWRLYQREKNNSSPTSGDQDMTD